MSGMTQALPITEALVLAAVLFALGLAAVIARRNVVFMLMGLEIMINATGLAFVAAGARWGAPAGQVMFIFILTLAAAEVSVGLALILRMFQHFKTVDADALRRMEG